MKAETVRNYLVVHTWTGILSSLLLFIAFYAGGLSMFEPEIAHWSRAEPVRADASADADALVAAFLAEPGNGRLRPKLVLAGDEHGAPFVEYQQDGRRQRVELDGSGNLRPLDGGAENAGDFVDHLHRKGGLPLPLEIAEPIIGFVALVYAIALISGVVVLLPSLVKDLFVLRVGRNLKRMWLDLHNLLGVSSLPFHVVMALTAAVFGLHDWIYTTQSTMIHPGGLSTVEARAAPVRPPVPLDPSEWLPRSAIVDRVTQAAPGFEPVALDYRGVGTAKAVVFVAGTDDRHFKRSSRVGYALVDPASGEIVESTYLPGRQESGWAAALSSFFALHFGSYGGEPVRVLYAVLGVLGALLFYTGNVLWIESRTKRLRQADAPPQQPRHVRWVASLNIGVCLGCVAGLSAAIVASRWLGRMPAETVTSVAYHLVFVACVAYAFARGAAGSVVALLTAAAVVTALIPATSLLVELMPDAFATWAPWLVKPYVRDFLFVDLLSAGGAAILAFLALRMRSRQPGGARLPRGSTSTPSSTAEAPIHD